MKNYLDLTDIDQQLQCSITLEPIGTPEVLVTIDDHCVSNKLSKSMNVNVCVDLLKPFCIEIELKNKIYDINLETAVVIKSIMIDGIELVPKFNHLASYTNDHNNNNPTAYLGFNGKWILTFDRPFYQWLHQATGQGWLIS
jgi:hypothetical protein